MPECVANTLPASKSERERRKVHHGFAKMNRAISIETSVYTSSIPVTIGFTVRDVCRSLRDLGAGDFEAAALDFIEAGGLEVVDDAELIGQYGVLLCSRAACFFAREIHAIQCNSQPGAHSEESKRVASAFDESCEVQSGKIPWLCGHFTGKAVAAIVRESARARAKVGTVTPSYLFWSTKSLVQPRGKVDEWERFLELVRNSPAMLRWASKGGKQASVLRPGRVCVEEGNTTSARDSYRKLMTCTSAQ